jgi:hypothetical protein
MFFKCFIKGGEKYIKEKCYSEIFEISSTREIAHQKIDKYCDEFVFKIKEYEKECLAIYEKSNIDKLKVQDSLKVHGNFLNNCKLYLNSQDIKDNEIESLKSETQKHVRALKRKVDDLNCGWFGAKALKFDQNTNMTSNFIGKLKFQNIFFSDQLKNLRQLNLMEIFNDESLEIERTEEDHFLFCFYNSTKENLSLAIITKEGVIQCENSNILSERKTVSIKEYRLFKINCDYLVYVSYMMSSKAKSEMYCFNKYLVFVKKIFFDRSIQALTVFQSDVYSLWSNNYYKCLTLSIIDENFEVTKGIGQPDPSKPFHFSKSISQIEANENYYFLLDRKQVNLMDRISGIISVKIKIETFQFFISMNRFIVTFKTRENKLNSYNFQGEMISEDCALFTTSTKLINTFDEILIFFDHFQALISF